MTKGCCHSTGQFFGWTTATVNLEANTYYPLRLLYIHMPDTYGGWFTGEFRPPGGPKIRDGRGFFFHPSLPATAPQSKPPPPLPPPQPPLSPTPQASRPLPSGLQAGLAAWCAALGLTRLPTCRQNCLPFFSVSIFCSDSMESTSQG